MVNEIKEKPICQRCHKEIENVWSTVELFSYRTLGGSIKTVYICLDCQMGQHLEIITFEEMNKDYIDYA